MIEQKGEVKYNKLDEYTLEVCDDNGCKHWTIETLDHALIQVEKDKDSRIEELRDLDESTDDIPDVRLETLEKYEDFYLNLISEAKNLGIKAKGNVRDIYSK